MKGPRLLLYAVDRGVPIFYEGVRCCNPEPPFAARGEDRVKPRSNGRQLAMPARPPRHHDDPGERGPDPDLHLEMLPASEGD